MRIVVSVCVLSLLAVAAFADPGVLEACVNPGNGGMRLVDAADACRPNETRVQWNIVGPAGPAGPAGPPGPAGSASSGPPFVYVCTPAAYFNNGGSQAALYVFNAGASSANVAVHFLDKDGTNLAGVTVPGSSPAATYPGETGAATVAVGSMHTRVVPWAFPAAGDPTVAGNVASTIHIVSDQPIAAGIDIQFSGFNLTPCMFVHP